ncbi:MAG: cupin domain-containing protein [Gemmatimonadales bacterium]
MTVNFLEPAASASFRSDRMAKADLRRGHRLFLGLNCFEPGQGQALHTHAGADKFYLIVSGKARMIVGAETRDVAAGTLVWAAAGEPHGVERALERTVMLVGMAPPPQGS